MAKKSLSTILLIGVSLLFSMSVALLAPLPLMVLRKSNGRLMFWLGSILTSAALAVFFPPVYPIVFSTAALLAGVFVELDESRVPYSACAGLSVLVGCLFLSGLAYLGYVRFGFDTVEFLRREITAILNQVPLPPGVVVDKESILKQVPSGLVICLTIATWFNSILAQRFEMPMPKKRRSPLKNWKTADSFVWLALASTAGTFLVTEPAILKWTATNIFNVVVLIYFFQGLAVLVHFLDEKRVTPFWRFMVYFGMIMFQLFLFVALVGFVDLWVDFRRRMKTDKSAIA